MPKDGFFYRYSKRAAGGAAGLLYGTLSGIATVDWAQDRSLSDPSITDTGYIILILTPAAVALGGAVGYRLMTELYDWSFGRRS